jgi:Fe-S-cluster containining protein
VLTSGRGVTIDEVTTYSLSIHADYRCRHSGACCSADWDVPVELPIYRTLSDALAAGTLRMSPDVDDRSAAFITEPGVREDAAAMLERTDVGVCVFFERGSRLCVVHRDLGERALPATCRHFPRIALCDARGTFVALSHFCPTAASMLFREDVPLEIVSEPAAFPATEYEGLIVHKDAWPPLLHPRMLMDLDGYSAWERHMVARCRDVTRSPESVVATLARDARLMRAWRPGGRSLAETVVELPATMVEASAHATLDASLERYREVWAAIPDDLQSPRDERGLGPAFSRLVRPVWDEFRAPVNRYLAAKAFATWSAYQGRGLATIVRGLEAGLALVRVEAARECGVAGRRLDAGLLREAFRSADYLLNHVATGEALAERWSTAEG